MHILQFKLYRSCLQAPAKDTFVRMVLAHPSHYGGLPMMHYTNRHIDIDTALAPGTEFTDPSPPCYKLALQL